MSEFIDGFMLNKEILLEAIPGTANFLGFMCGYLLIIGVFLGTCFLIGKGIAFALRTKNR